MKYITLKNIYRRGEIESIRIINCLMLSHNEFLIYTHYLDNKRVHYHHNRQGIYFEGIHVIPEEVLKPTQEWQNIEDLNEKQSQILQKLTEIINNTKIWDLK